MLSVWGTAFPYPFPPTLSLTYMVPKEFCETLNSTPAATPAASGDLPFWPLSQFYTLVLPYYSIYFTGISLGFK